MSADTVWNVARLAGDTYRFAYGAEGAAGQIRIIGANSEPIEPFGPIHKTDYFDQEMPPGDYTISWHWMEGRPDIRSSIEFTLPFAGERLKLVL